MRGTTLLRISGVVLLLLASAVLLMGTYLTVIGAVSFGEYANPPPSIGAKVRDVLPLAVWTLIAAAVPAILGAALILISRRLGDSHRVSGGGRGEPETA
jgi:Zn-dependent alcohol dehydrogenase